MKRHLIAPITLACALFGAANANADTVAFNGYAQKDFEWVSMSLAGSGPNKPLNEPTVASGFITSLNGGPSFTSYCINLYEGVDPFTTYTAYTATNTDGHVFANAKAATDLGKLFAEANVIGDSVASAAMQIAIWEIAYETTGTYDVSSGDLKFTKGSEASPGALTLANTWLAALGSQTTGVPLGVFQSTTPPVPQDRIFAAPVPEPSTYALFAGGLMCIGFMARRRAARQG